MRGILLGIRRMICKRNGVYCSSSSIGEIASPTIPDSYSYSLSSVTTKPSSCSKFHSGQQLSNRNRNHCSSASSSLMIITGGSRVVMVESKAELNTLLRKVKDESLSAVFYFTAVWCEPCRFVGPLFLELSEIYTNATIYKIDIDQVFKYQDQDGLRVGLQNLKVPAGVRGGFQKLTISDVPTLLFFKGGKMVSESKIVGADLKRFKTTMEDLYN